jgi:ferredoxin-thioredoxin reductase catalytic subunit
MRIDDIVNLTDAELINRGFINEIDLFFDNLKDSKRGGAFFSDNADEINRAIKKGVYAIIYSTDIEVTDKEIAWIKVESLEEAKIALLKYRLLDKTLYITDEIGIEIIKSIVKDKRIAMFNTIDMNSQEFKDEQEKTISFAKKVVESQGWEFNEDKEIVDTVIMGLTRNKLLYGKRFCPCFMVIEENGKYKSADNRICPCKPAIQEEIPNNGMCHCGIFVKKDR